MASPMPLLDPVTKATFPENSLIVSPWLVSGPVPAVKYLAFGLRRQVRDCNAAPPAPTFLAKNQSSPAGALHAWDAASRAGNLPHPGTVPTMPALQSLKAITWPI
jgi:hypothetical protein